MNIIRGPKVISDLIELADYLSEDNPDAAYRFLNAFESTIEQLAQFPEIGTRRYFQHAELSNIRMWFVQGFKNYLIFYRVLDDAIQIVRVLHRTRDIEAALEEDQ
jgi:toxin ParE1/3/4